MIYRLYRGLTTLGAPLIALYLRWRRALGKEDRARFAERLGVASVPRPAGRLVWLHAASLGESLSLLPVVERLRSDFAVNVLMTTGTVSSAEVMRRRLPDGAIHQYVPVDRMPWVRRFLAHWRPDLALWTESEFWPNMVSIVADQKIPLVLLNGRVSDRSFARWRRQPRLIGKLLGGFDLCLAQTELDAQRLDELGARRVRCCGNLKFAATAQVPDVTRVADLAGSGFDRPCWLAASTHAGEELMAGRLHQTLKPRLPGLLTVIVPRHPERSATIVAELTGLGLAVRCRSQGQAIDGETDILLGDTLGEMGLFLQLASVVFMGKSLYGHGGQNPLEPAGFGRAVLYGPNMENFIDIAERMAKAGAAEQVADEDALAAAVALRLGDHARLADDGRKALEFARSEQGVLDRVMRELAPFLTATEDCRARA